MSANHTTMTNKLITIASFSSDFEAEIAKGKLQSSGIESFIFKDDCGGMRPHMLLTAGVQLKVIERDLPAYSGDLGRLNRKKSAACSGRSRPPKPEQSGHLVGAKRRWF